MFKPDEGPFICAILFLFLMSVKYYAEQRCPTSRRKLYISFTSRTLRITLKRFYIITGNACPVARLTCFLCTYRLYTKASFFVDISKIRYVIGMYRGHSQSLTP